jgi:predicted amidohydrolase YtcJ
MSPSGKVHQVARGSPPGVSAAADLAFVGGVVHRVDAVGSRAWAVAVRGGRIVAVGTDDEIRAHVGPRTEVVDLAGRMLLPGFQDAHIHAQGGGMDRLRVDLSTVHSLEAYEGAIGRYAAAEPEVPWILGGGWAMDVFEGGTPSKEQLDRIVPDRPAFIANRDNHAAWVNNRALELADVDARAADPDDGRIERLADGSPQGTLHEGAMTLVRRLIPEPSQEDRERAVLIAQGYLHSLGITAWQEAIVGEYPTVPNARDVYPALAGRGALTGRVVGALWLERGRGVEQIEELLATRDATSGGRYRADTVKIMLDGICENFTAALDEPYLDRDGSPTGNRGIEYFDPEVLRELAIRLDAEGFQLHIHVIGERACRDALDAIEAARRANGWTDGRHHLAHIQLVHPDDLSRFRALGVTANAQMLWAGHDPQMDEFTIPFIGPERSGWQYPFGSLAASGATLCAGSDWPVSTPDPLQEMHVGVHRTPPPDYVYGVSSDEPFLPGERLSLAQAIRAFTMGSAYVNHLDDETGSIEVGKLADLVVVSDDLFALDSPADARVLLTLIGGETVYEAPDSGL